MHSFSKDHQGSFRLALRKSQAERVFFSRSFWTRLFSVIILLLIFFSADSRLQAQSLNDAYLALQDALEKNPEDLNLQMDLAFLFSQGREINRAVTIYEKVVAEDPRNIRAVTELCVLETELRNQEDALQWCRRAVEIDPQALAFDNLGLSLFKFGQFRVALRPFLKALALQKDNIMVLSHLAQTYLALGEREAAQKVLEESLDKAQGDSDKLLIFNALSIVYQDLKDYDRAFTATLETYKLSANPLFVGKVVSAALRAHQFITFIVISLLTLGGAHYLGKRLNRFLKNEA